MTITLEDIARCWGLRVSGLPVLTGAANANPDLVRPLLQRLFGAQPYLGSSQIDIEWLWEAYGPARARISDRRSRDQAEFLAEHEAQMVVARDLLAGDGGGGSAPTVSEHAKMDGADIIRPDAGIYDGEGAATYSLGDEGGDEASDSDDEEYVMPLDEPLTYDDSDDSIDDGDSEDEGVKPRRATRRVVEVERDSDGERARDDGGDDVVPPIEYEGREVPVDGYYRRKRVGIPCETFHVGRRRPDLMSH